MIVLSEDELLTRTFSEKDNGRLFVRDMEAFSRTGIDDILDTLVLGKDPAVSELAGRIVRQAARQAGVIPHSIDGLYQARSQRDMPFSVPALNLRTLTYDLARAVFRAAMSIEAGAFIFEIARSEIGYTGQRPWDYTAAVLLAAVREGYGGPVFIQGDHFQVKPKSFFQERAAEMKALKDLIAEAVEAGFYNIDIDASTLVDLSKPGIEDQQALNAEITAELASFIRDIQPRGLEISVGGEIGEVGGHNSTPEELRAFMAAFRSLQGKKRGLSKISIQTGTTHGGVVLPDGSIADVKIDFRTLKDLSRIARNEFGLAGAVQHGASTLPREAFSHFPDNECAEVHLATQFQNIVYDHLPEDLKTEIYGWLRTNAVGERKANETEEQFLYKTRKKALGPFKKEIYSLPREVKDRISAAVEEEFSFLFDRLRIAGSRTVVDEVIVVDRPSGRGS